MHAFPKIFTIGQGYIKDLFKEPVEVTEKVDGSQFVFGLIDGTLHMRSKGKEMFEGAIDTMFKEGAEHALDLFHRGLLAPNVVYYCEYLKKPKHNALKYDRVPTNHLALFGCSAYERFFDYPTLCDEAKFLGIDVVPRLYEGMVDSMEQLTAFFDRESYLGGPKIEGVVCKRYTPWMLGGEQGHPMPIMCGKLVSEKFKEVHRDSWKKEHTSKGHWEDFVESFRTEARWQKAVQHLRDEGLLEGSPRDIGALMRTVNEDLIAEEQQDIMEWMWKNFHKEILRKATAGLPEWYKQQLAAQSFE